jgi:predicted DNA-binding ribbon-helix-helix protein
MSASGLIQKINSFREHDNLSSVIRVFVFNYYRERPNKLSCNRRRMATAAAYTDGHIAEHRE